MGIDCGLAGRRYFVEGLSVFESAWGESGSLADFSFEEEPRSEFDIDPDNPDSRKVPDKVANKLGFTSPSPAHDSNSLATGESSVEDDVEHGDVGSDSPELGESVVLGEALFNVEEEGGFVIGL